MMTSIIMQILTPVVTSLASVLAVQLMSILVQHFGIRRLQKFQELLNTHRELVKDVVKFVQQRYGACDGETKLKLACDEVAKQFERFGIKVPAEQIEIMIESTLLTLKYEFGEAWKNVVNKNEGQN
jgi:hypothetical protein